MQLDHEDAIRRRAYARWQQDGRPEGKDLDHWLRAEIEIAAERYAGVTENGKFIRRADLTGEYLAMRSFATG